MRMILIGFAMGIAAVISPRGVSAECSPGDFFNTTDYKEDRVIQLSLAWNLSETEFNKRTQGGGVTVPIYGVPVTGSYSDYRASVKKKAEELRIDRFEQRAISYATSVLTGSGLEAYKACLKSERGDFRLWVGEVGSENYYQFHLSYVPAKISGGAEWRVVSTDNLDDDSEAILRKEILHASNASRELDLGLSLRPRIKKQEAQITIGLESVTHGLILPPLDRPKVKGLEPPCLEANSAGECLRCKGTFNAEAMGTSTEQYFFCQGRAAGKFVGKVRGTVCVNQGQGSNISLYAEGPDGKRYGKSGPGQDGSPFYFTSGGAGNCAAFEVYSPQLGIEADSKNVRGALRMETCHNNTPPTIATCRVVNSEWQLWSAQTSCKSWLRLSEQNLRIDKWSACQG